MRTTLSIAQGFYQSESLPISAQRAVNWRPNVPQTSTITDANLFPTEGIAELVDGGINDFCRGAHVLAGTPYFVITNNLVRLNLTTTGSTENFTLNVIGTIEGNQRVFMSDNGTQLCITAAPDSVTSGKSYIFTESPDTLTEITDSNFDGPALSNLYVGGYFFFHKSNGKEFFNSPLNNGLTGYNPFDFNVAEADPDQIRALGSINNQLYVFGSQTIQIFRNIGRDPAPFAPIEGAVYDYGITNSQTLVKVAGGLAFVGQTENQTPAVFFTGGGEPTKISTIAIENELSASAQDSFFCWHYGESGAVFLGVGTDKTCFVYDFTNQRWHERLSIGESGLEPFRVSHAVTGYERVLLGDRITGKIGQIDENIYTEYGFIVPRFVISRPFDNTGESVSLAAIEAIVESGVGTENDITVSTGFNPDRTEITTQTGSDPQITLSWSDDGGRTFKGLLSRALGKIGQYLERPIWYRLGQFSRDRVLRFECTTPNKAVLIKVEADID